jgi:hypothetical protein
MLLNDGRIVFKNPDSDDFLVIRLDGELSDVVNWIYKHPRKYVKELLEAKITYGFIHSTPKNQDVKNLILASYQEYLAKSYRNFEPLDVEMSNGEFDYYLYYDTYTDYKWRFCCWKITGNLDFYEVKNLDVGFYNEELKNYFSSSGMDELSQLVIQAAHNLSKCVD